jgi:hypothetical protein
MVCYIGVQQGAWEWRVLSGILGYKGKEEEGGGGNCVMRSGMICAVQQVLGRSYQGVCDGLGMEYVCNK